jgi:hypothetical protein
VRRSASNEVVSFRDSNEDKKKGGGDIHDVEAGS